MFKKIFLFATIILFACSAHAQFYFGNIPKPAQSRSVIAGAPDEVITKNIVGPAVNLISYSTKDRSILYGAGFGFKHMKFNNGSNEWDEVWSVNVLGWNKDPLTSAKSAFAYGIAGGVSLGLISPKLESPYKILGGLATTNIQKSGNLFGTIGIGYAINR